MPGITENTPRLDITPSVADVGAVLRARTKDINGVEVGTSGVRVPPSALVTRPGLRGVSA
jgi:hypothetical protein